MTGLRASVGHVVCPTLVGRARELEALAALAAASAAAAARAQIAPWVAEQRKLGNRARK